VVVVGEDGKQQIEDLKRGVGSKEGVQVVPFDSSCKSSRPLEMGLPSAQLAVYYFDFFRNTRWNRYDLDERQQVFFTAPSVQRMEESFLKSYPDSDQAKHATVKVDFTLFTRRPEVGSRL